MPNGYCFDASLFIEGMKRYPANVQFFAPIWDKVDTLVAGGRGFCCREVLEELERREGDMAHAFVSDRRDQMILPPTRAAEEYILELVRVFPDRGWDLAATRRDNADPWVVALAKTNNLVVVTDEFRRSTGRLRMQDACQHLGVPCLRLIDFISEITAPDQGARPADG